MKKKIIFSFIFLFLVLLSYVVISKNIDNSNNQFFTKIKLMIPYEIRQSIKKNIFVYSYTNILEKKIAKKEKNLVDLSHKFTSIHGIHFKEVINKKIITSQNKKKYYYKEFKAELLPLTGTHGYFNLYNENIFLITKSGIINYGNINLLNNKKFNFNVIPSNLLEFANYRKFIEHKHYGVKGLLIDQDQIYVSLIYELKKGCYNTSIFVAKLNFEKIEFKKFFSPKTCVDENDDYFNIVPERLQPLQSGGEMTLSKDNNIIFSTGEFRKRDLAQDKNSIFGKIIEINRSSKKYKILSMGHRNPQGLYFNFDKNILIATEHSAQGGDEININYSIENDEIKNYGWPISSYGEHYDYNTDDKLKKLYEIAPLNKSHTEFGFVEPIKYYDLNSRGPGVINKLNKNFSNLGDNQYMVSLMGSRQLHHMIFNDEHTKILENDILKFGGKETDYKHRVRDIIYDDSKNRVLLLFEKNITLKDEEYAYWIGILETLN